MQNKSILEIKLVIGENMQIKIIKIENTEFDVQSSDTIQEIKRRIQDKNGIQPTEQT